MALFSTRFPIEHWRIAWENGQPTFVHRIEKNLLYGKNSLLCPEGYIWLQCWRTVEDGKRENLILHYILSDKSIRGGIYLQTSSNFSDPQAPFDSEYLTPFALDSRNVLLDGEKLCGTIRYCDSTDGSKCLIERYKNTILLESSQVHESFEITMGESGGPILEAKNETSKLELMFQGAGDGSKSKRLFGELRIKSQKGRFNIAIECLQTKSK